MKQLWVEKYRPSTVDGYVFQNADEKKQIETWIKDKSIPHLLFSGPAGTGKTTLAKILINQCEVDEFDVKEINASRDNGVEYIRTAIEGFVQTMPFGDFKVVLLDEADYLSRDAQAVLRGLMEKYASSSRFILTCNFPNKIIGPLHSRCQGFHISKINHTDFTARVAEVLIQEDIDFDIDVLDSYVKATYPDLRKCLNMAQMNSTEGTLLKPSATVVSGGDEWKVTVVDLIKGRKYTKARELICASVRPEDIEGVYKWMYDNLDLWGEDEQAHDRAILKIRTGIVNHAFVADPEINLAATLIELLEG